MQAKEVIGEGEITIRNESSVKEYQRKVIIVFFLFHENSNGKRNLIIHQSQVQVCQVINMTIGFELEELPAYNYSLQLHFIEQIEKVLPK
jgi:hypothetical protein